MSISTAIDASAVARGVGIKTEFKDLRAGRIVNLPQRIAVVAQVLTGGPASGGPGVPVSSAFEAGTVFGFGSPIHLIAKQLFPANGDGVGTVPVTVYSTEDPGSGVAAEGDMAPFGTTATAAGAFRIIIGGVKHSPFNIAIGDNLAAVNAAIAASVNATIDSPATATEDGITTTCVAKWIGTSANGMVVDIEFVGGTFNTGFIFVGSTMAGASTDADVAAAIAEIGDTWETLLINSNGPADAVALDAISTFGEGRWGALVRKPLVAFVGDTQPAVANAIAIPDARPTDRVNVQISAPGSSELAFVIAARAVARIAVVANNNPPTGYAGQVLSGLELGTPGQQWSYAERDLVVKGGASTTESKNGEMVLSDTVTFFHPDGDPNPAYRYVVDIIKLMTIVYNLDLIFTAPGWAGAPLIPDDQPTTNENARKPSGAVAAVSTMLDNLGLAAIISDPETAKANTFAEIDGTNPKRLNVATTVQISGNVNIISVDLNFGFFFGGV